MRELGVNLTIGIGFRMKLWQMVVGYPID